MENKATAESNEDSENSSDTRVSVYQRIFRTPHHAKIFNQSYYVRRDIWNSSICQNGPVKDVTKSVSVVEKFAMNLMKTGKQDLAFSFWVDALNTIVSACGIFLEGPDVELTMKLVKSQMVKVKSLVTQAQFASKTAVVAVIFLNKIESAQRKKKYARAGELLDETIKRIEQLEPCEFTAWIWQMKGIQVWSTLENKAFCAHPEGAFQTIFECFCRCRYHLTIDLDIKGQFVKHEATLALSSMIRACLMLPVDLEDISRIQRYVIHYLPSEELLRNAWAGLKQFETESRAIGPKNNYFRIYWSHQIDLQIYIFIYHIRLAQLLHQQMKTTEAIEYLNVWLYNVGKSELLCMFGLQDFLEEIIHHLISLYSEPVQHKTAKKKKDKNVNPQDQSLSSSSDEEETDYQSHKIPGLHKTGPGYSTEYVMVTPEHQTETDNIQDGTKL